jgi:hypothetical protein
MGAWTEIVDYTVPSNTTSVVLNTFGTITKDDFIKVVLTIVGGGAGNIAAYPNTTAGVSGFNTETNYHRQILRGDGSGIEVNRANRTEIAYTAALNAVSTSIAYVKISENGKYNLFANYSIRLDSSHDLVYGYTTSSNLTFNDPITSLTFAHLATNGIGTGSRIQIYRLDAEKVADITVATNSTQVDIPSLSIGKGDEYLLVSDISSAGGDYLLTPNDLTTNTQYYSQLISGVASTASANRVNTPRFATGSNTFKSMSHIHIKVSEIGAFTAQSYEMFQYGTSNVSVFNWFISSTYENLTSITKLNVRSTGTNQIESGSRFILYKLK